MSPRVLHLVAGAEHGGAETFSTDLICALADRGIEQAVVTRPWPDRLATFARHPIGTVIPFGFGGWAPLGRMKLRAPAAAFAPDVTVAWMGRAAAFAPRLGGPMIGWFGGYYDLKRYRGAGWYVGVTDDIRAHIVRSGAPDARARTIHTYAELPPAVPADRAALGTPENAFVTLALSRLHPKKGLDTLIAAIATLPERYHLWIAGEGELRAALEDQIRGLGIGHRVKLLGWRTDRAALLGAADLCALPSRYEPFGTVVLEAWAARVPLVAARAAGPAAHVDHGEDGLLVDIDDVPELARAIRMVANDPALGERLVKHAAARYAAHFSKDACVARWLALLADVTGSIGR